ncbi:MAG: lycopene cyclase domain-containing protein [Bacteroidia bacterium]
MNPHWTYALLHIGAFTFPFLLSFDKKVAFYKSWKFLFPAILIVAAFFVIWDIWFTSMGVWGFAPNYFLGGYFFNLPWEEVLFFITIPYCCIFVYACLNTYITRDLLASSQRYITIIAALVAVSLGLIFYDRAYTFSTGILAAAMLVWFGLLRKEVWMGRFWLSYLVVLIPFFICNGILTSKPVVWYNDAENMGVRLWTIPAEDLMYNLIMLLGVTALFEYFKKRAKN